MPFKTQNVVQTMQMFAYAMHIQHYISYSFTLIAQIVKCAYVQIY